MAEIVNFNFVLPNNYNTPIGGYKIVYEYANLLVEEGHDVTITFMLFDATPFSYDKLRGKLSKLKVGLLFFLGHIYTSHKTVDWFPLDSRIKIKFSLPWNFFFPVSDIVIATAWQTAYTVMRLNRKRGRKFYLIQHDESVFGPQNLVRKTWFFPLKKIAIASWLKELVEDVTAQDVMLVKNFVDTDTFYVTTPLNRRKNVVSMLYHDNPSKGSADGISILKKVKTRVPDLEVRLFGTGNPPKNLPDYFQFVRKANNTQLRDIYNQSIIYLFPSHLEGWGLTATEAMACGAALVSTKNGGVNDFGIQNETALLSDVGDIDGISENIINLIYNPDKRKKLAQNGQVLVSELTKLRSFSDLKKSLDV